MPRTIDENRANKNSDNSDAERFCQTYCRTFWAASSALKSPEISRPVGARVTSLFEKIVLQGQRLGRVRLFVVCFKIRLLKNPRANVLP